MNAETIMTEALRLSPEVRAFLAERLLESLDAEPGTGVSSAWRAEIERRCKAIDEGATALREASEVFASAYKALD